MKKLLLLLFFVSGILFSETFKVEKISGNVILNGSIKVLSNTTIDEKDRIEIIENSYLIVSNSSKKKLEIRKSGIYSGAKIKSQFRLSNINVNSKLAKSLLDDLSESEDLLENSSLTENMSTLGAVERSILNPNIVYSPRNSHALPEVNFKWFPVAKMYRLVILDIKGETLYSISTNQTELTLNISIILPNAGECFFWYLEYDNKKTDEFCIFLYSLNEILEIRKEEDLLKSQLNLLDPVDNMIMAKFYESYDLVTESIYYYERCVTLNPEIEEHLLMYYKFLTGKGISELPVYLF